VLEQELRHLENEQSQLKSTFNSQRDQFNRQKQQQQQQQKKQKQKQKQNKKKKKKKN
jgi:hypothetical protein